MTTLVFSYSHADEAQRNELEKHLSLLKRMGKITTWPDPESFLGKISNIRSITILMWSPETPDSSCISR